LTTCLTVAVVMGGLSYFERREAFAVQRRARETLLAKALAPLADRLERAGALAEAEGELAAFHGAYRDRGYLDHQVALVSSDGTPLTASFRAAPAGRAVIRAAVEVRAPYLPSGAASLVVYERAPELAEAAALEWRAWAVHLAATALAIMGVLGWTIHRLVALPLRRLLADVRRMEMGYWGDVGAATGAWEVAWVAWRFRGLGRELESAVSRLVAAERRAAAARPARESGGGAAAGQEAEAGLPPSPSARNLDEDEAGRVDPEGVARVRREAAALRWRWRRRARGAVRRLRSTLDEEGVPCVALARRFKSPAAIWRKMREKDLSVAQVQDWFAVRIVVPTESDCYWALGVVHRAFDPIPGRFDDYVAEPKANGYRGLHTCLRDSDGFTFEVQIRSAAMHREAEGGSAAHWLYKSAGRMS
jgi:hypothetical protein